MEPRPTQSHQTYTDSWRVAEKSATTKRPKAPPPVPKRSSSTWSQKKSSGHHDDRIIDPKTGAAEKPQMIDLSPHLNEATPPQSKANQLSELPPPVPTQMLHDRDKPNFMPCEALTPLAPEAGPSSDSDSDSYVSVTPLDGTKLSPTVTNSDSEEYVHMDSKPRNKNSDFSDIEDYTYSDSNPPSLLSLAVQQRFTQDPKKRTQEFDRDPPSKAKEEGSLKCDSTMLGNSRRKHRRQRKDHVYMQTRSPTALQVPASKHTHMSTPPPAAREGRNNKELGSPTQKLTFQESIESSANEPMHYSDSGSCDSEGYVRPYTFVPSPPKRKTWGARKKKTASTQIVESQYEPVTLESDSDDCIIPQAPVQQQNTIRRPKPSRKTGKNSATPKVESQHEAIESDNCKSDADGYLILQAFTSPAMQHSTTHKHFTKEPAHNVINTSSTRSQEEAYTYVPILPGSDNYRRSGKDIQRPSAPPVRKKSAPHPQVSKTPTGNEKKFDHATRTQDNLKEFSRLKLTEPVSIPRKPVALQRSMSRSLKPASKGLQGNAHSRSNQSSPSGAHTMPSPRLPRGPILLPRRSLDEKQSVKKFQIQLADRAALNSRHTHEIVVLKTK